jgi:hypothetical protein
MKESKKVETVSKKQWIRYFQYLWTPKREKSQPLSLQQQHTEEFTLDELHCVLTESKSNKAPGECNIILNYLNIQEFASKRNF